MKLNSVPGPVWYMAGAAVVGLLAWRAVKGGAKAVAGAVNPASQGNLANQLVTGGGSWSPGAALYNAVDEIGSWFGGDDEDDLAAPATATSTVTRTPYGNPPNANTEGRSSTQPRPVDQVEQ